MRIGLRFALLLAVLLQYGPTRICSVERALFGWSCHEQSTHSASEDVAAEEFLCASRSMPSHGCVCNAPKVQGQHQTHAARFEMDCAMVAVVTHGRGLRLELYRCPSPDPLLNVPRAQQLPLLI